MKQRIVFLASCLFVLVSLSGCVDKQKQEIDKYRNQLKEEINKQVVTPTGRSEIGIMDSIKYENDSILAWYFTVNEQLYFIDAINKNVEAAKKYAQSAFVDNLKFSSGANNFLDLLVKSNSWLKVVFVGDYSNEQAIIMLNPQEIKNAVDNNANESFDLRTLKTQVYASNMQSPCRVDEITTLDSCGLSNNYLVYCYTLEDDNIDMLAFENNSLSLKKDFSTSLQTLQYTPIVKACVGCNKGIMYWYIGRNSGHKVEISFSSDELKTIIDQSSSISY